MSNGWAMDIQYPHLPSVNFILNGTATAGVDVPMFPIQILRAKVRWSCRCSAQTTRWYTICLYSAKKGPKIAERQAKQAAKVVKEVVVTGEKKDKVKPMKEKKEAEALFVSHAPKGHKKGALLFFLHGCLYWYRHFVLPCRNPWPAATIWSRQNLPGTISGKHKVLCTQDQWRWITSGCQ